MSGHYRPRERLIEQDLARELGVSRTSLREALRRLVAEGLLVVIHRRGTFVVELSEDDLKEIYSLRLALEVLAVETLIETITPAQIKELRDLLVEMGQPLAPTDIRTRVDRDLRFHEAICRFSGHSRLFAIWSKMGDQLRSYFATDYRLGDEPGIVETHRALLDCIEARDKEAALATLRQHILEAAARVGRSGLVRSSSSSLEVATR